MNAAAIILAGGRGSRLGGIHKPGLELGGATLLARCIAAARLGECAPIVAVGPVMEAEGVDVWVREDPPLGGPAAGIAAGVECLGPDAPEWVVVLAADLVRPELVVAALAEAAPGTDGAVLIDPDGQEQWLAARYRLSALREAIRNGAAPSLDGVSIRRLVGELALARVPAPATTTADIDTWEDLEHARDQSPRT